MVNWTANVQMAVLRSFRCLTPYTRAKEVLAAARDRPPYPMALDLQRHPVELDDHPFLELGARARTLSLADVHVRVLGSEDQLRMTCLHLLRHEGRRPLWWCDIGAIMEATPVLDWDLVVRGSHRRAVWLACVVRLSHQLLAVRIDTLPPYWRRQPVPNWLTPAIYRRWEDGMETVPSRDAMSYVRNPGGLRQGLYERWPNPLGATLRWGGYPDASSRWPYQLRDLLWRGYLYGYRHLPPWRARFMRRRQEDAQDLVDRRLLTF